MTCPKCSARMFSRGGGHFHCVICGKDVYPPAQEIVEEKVDRRCKEQKPCQHGKCKNIATQDSIYCSDHKRYVPCPCGCGKRIAPTSLTCREGRMKREGGITKGGRILRAINQHGDVLVMEQLHEARKDNDIRQYKEAHVIY